MDSGSYSQHRDSDVMSREESGESQRYLYEQTLNYKFNIYVPPEEAELPSVKSLPMKKYLSRPKAEIRTEKAHHAVRLREALAQIPINLFQNEESIWSQPDQSKFLLHDSEPTIEETALFNKLKTEKIFKLPDYATRSAGENQVLKKYLQSLPASSMKPIAKEFKNRLNFLLDSDTSPLGQSIVCLLMLISDDFKEGCIEHFLTEFLTQPNNKHFLKPIVFLMKEERFCRELLSILMDQPENLAAVPDCDKLILEALKAASEVTRIEFTKRFLDYCSDEYHEKIEDDHILQILGMIAPFVDASDDAQLVEITQANLLSFFTNSHMLTGLYTVLLKNRSPTFARDVREFGFRDLCEVLQSPQKFILVRILINVDELESSPAFLDAFIKQVGPAFPDLKRIMSSAELSLCLSLGVINNTSIDYVEMYRLDIALHSVVLTAPDLLSEGHIRLLLRAIELNLEEQS